MAPETEIGGQGREFPNTRWTLILSSRDQTQARSTALKDLLETYWKPLYFFVRRKGLQVEAAKDAIQGFMLHLLEKDFLARLDPERGKLRSYLRTAMSHFLINQHEKATTGKRGGDAVNVSLDWDVAERGLATMPDAPESAFDKEWAEGVMESCLNGLRNEFQSGGRSGPIELVEAFFSFKEAMSYKEASEKFKMGIPQLKAFLHRARGRFRELVREEVGHTVADPAEIDGEVRDLIRLLSS